MNNKNSYAFLTFNNVFANQNVSIQISSFYIITSNDSFTAVQITNCIQVQFILKNISINVQAINTLPISFLLADSGNITIFGFNLNLLDGYAAFIKLLCNSQTNTSLTIVNSLIRNYMVPVLKTSFGIIHISSEGSSNSCSQTLNIVNTSIEKAVIKKIDNWTQDFSAIYADYSGNINIFISQSKFQYINSIRGPAINLNNCLIPPTSNNSIISFNTTNSSNTQNDTNLASQTTTQITYYAYNSYVIIDDSKFTNNSAYLEGGAIYNTYNNLTITNTNFTSNQAEYRTGAAIFSLDTNSLTMIKSISNNNTFFANKRFSKKLDGMYLDNAPLGSPPISMNLTIIKTSKSYANIVNYTSNNSFLITNVSSYDLNALKFIVGLFDFLGQIFYESPNGDIELNVTLQNKRMLQILTSTSSSSSINCDFMNCYITDTTLVLKGMAGILLPINITYQSSQNNVPNLMIDSMLRSCKLGEINSSQIEGGDPKQSICTFCPYKSYSLNLNDSSCSECNFEDAADCLGGAYLSINPGYWRKNNFSDVIYKCLNPSACAGGFNSECTYGYIGSLCQSCNISANFARTGRNGCEVCPTQERETLITFGFMILVIAYQMYITRSSLLENFAMYQNKMTLEAEKARTQGKYVRSLNTYTQIISIVLTFQLEYPTFFQQSVGTATTNPINSMLTSTICFVINLGYDAQSIIFYKLALVSAMPFIKMIIISFIVTIILFTCKRKIDPALKKAYYFVTIFSTIIVDQPALFNNLVSFLTCIQIGNEGPYYLLSDYGVECYTPNYNAYLLFFVFPSILFWGVIIPAILFIVMFRYRKNLSNKFLRLNFGGIYDEYTDKAYYWGIILMLTKLLLMLSTSLLYNDTKTEAMTVFIILCIYLVANRYIRPIKKPEIDKVELMSNSTYLITVFFFALYYKDTRYIACEILAIVILTAVNFFMIGFFLYKIIILNISTSKLIKKYLSSRGRTRNNNKDETIQESEAHNNIDKTEEKKDLKSEENNTEQHYSPIKSPMSFPIDSHIEIDLNSPLEQKRMTHIELN